MDRRFPSEDEARAFRAAAEAALGEERRQAARGHVTVAFAREQYFAAERAAGRAPTSIDQYRRDLGRLLRDEDLLAALAPMIMARRYIDLSQSGCAAATHQNSLVTTRRFFVFCRQEGWLRADPLAEVKPIGRRNRRKVQLDARDARAWWAMAEERSLAGDRRAFVAWCTLALGLRSMEIYLADVRAIDDVHAPYDSWRVYRATTKNDDSVRVVTIPEEMRPVFALHLEGRRERRDEPLFAGTRTARIHRQYPCRAVQYVSELAGVARVGAHAMRGACATLAFEAGLAPLAVARSLGHKSPSMTRRHYALPGAGVNATLAAGRALMREPAQEPISEAMARLERSLRQLSDLDRARALAELEELEKRLGVLRRAA